MEDGQPCFAELSAEARRLYARLHFDAEEAEFGAAQSRARAADQWNRSNHVHSRGGAQSAGALDRAHPRRPCEGSSRCPLSRGARRARYRRCREPQTEPVEVWGETSQSGDEVTGDDEVIRVEHAKTQRRRKS